MRFIIHELPYERPVMGGVLRYERGGEPTGAVETWRLTDAVDGYRFLRVDLDAREAASGRSTLYHLTLAPDGRPEQLKYRFWGDGLEISGAAVWDDGAWVAAREVNGAAYEDVARGAAFWFPSGMGLALLRRFDGEHSAVTLATETADPGRAMTLVQTEVSVRGGAEEPVVVVGEELPGEALTVAWEGTWRTVWLGKDGVPLRLMRDDGLMATAERIVRYGR